jgi:hypothetical protein
MRWNRPPPTNEELNAYAACRRVAREIGTLVEAAFRNALRPHGLLPPALIVRVRGVRFPIEFADWTHERLYSRYYEVNHASRHQNNARR